MIAVRDKIIAIDGPAGSGKSTLGRRLAEVLGYLYFDTGVMYRVVTSAALARGLDLENEAQITALAERILIDVQPASIPDGRENDIFADGVDVTWEIRKPEVDAQVSIVAAYPGVRKALGEQQRRVGLRGHVVMVGRDIGTVILPDADVKIYLDASAEERARRRYRERLARGEQADFAEILRLIRLRDALDSTRAVSPLRPAEDAFILSSDDLDMDQVLERAKELVGS
jgi:cytidylate kinase